MGKWPAQNIKLLWKQRQPKNHIGFFKKKFHLAKMSNLWACKRDCASLEKWGGTTSVWNSWSLEPIHYTGLPFLESLLLKAAKSDM